MKIWLVLLAAALLSGCQRPYVYLYSKYLAEAEQQQLSAQLTEQGFEVVSNQLAFPAKVTSTSILYSPLLRHPDDVDRVKSILAVNGLDVAYVSGLVEGSHFVTKNGMAIFAVPNPAVFHSPIKIGQTFKSHNCDAQLTLTFGQKREAVVTGSNLHQVLEWRLIANDKIVQLTKPSGSNYNFEVTQGVAHSPVGVVDEVILKPIMDYRALRFCQFYDGVVRAAL